MQKQCFSNRDIRLGGLMFWNHSKKGKAEFLDSYFNAHHLVVERHVQEWSRTNVREGQEGYIP